MRLIDADVLSQYIKSYSLGDGVGHTSKTFLYAVDRQPTIEAVSVVHGKWEETDYVKYDGHGECVHYPKKGLRCSNCYHCYNKDYLWDDNFCPNCGAKMK